MLIFVALVNEHWIRQGHCSEIKVPKLIRHSHINTGHWSVIRVNLTVSLYPFKGVICSCKGTSCCSLPSNPGLHHARNFHLVVMMITWLCLEPYLGQCYVFFSPLHSPKLIIGCLSLRVSDGETTETTPPPFLSNFTDYLLRTTHVTLLPDSFKYTWFCSYMWF